MFEESQIKPEITVVIPCYNREKSISKAIESVLYQDFENWELIIVDDCSTDKSLELILDYCQRDNRIKGFKLDKNSGAAAARNFGIKKARSSYVSLLDSDDWYEALFLSKSFTKIKTTPDSVGFIWTGINWITDKGEMESSWSNSYPFNSYMNFLHSLHIGTSAGITFKNKIFDIVGYFREDLPAAEDTEFFLRLSKFFDYDNIKESLINIDKRGTDRMSTNYENIAIAYNKFLPDHFETIQKYPALQKKYYYKMMWLNYYRKDKREARKYFKFQIQKFNLTLKSFFIFIIFEISPFELAKKIHQLRG